MDNARDMDKKGRRVNTPHRGEKHGMHILTEEQAREVRRRVEAGEKQNVIAKEFGIKSVTVSAIKTRRIWKWMD